MDTQLLRSWDATATPEGAASYVDHFAAVVLPHLRSLPGFRGAYLLTRDDAVVVRVRALTFWHSLDAVRAFSGPDTTAATVDPDAQRMLGAFDATVTNFHVAIPRDAADMSEER